MLLSVLHRVNEFSYIISYNREEGARAQCAPLEERGESLSRGVDVSAYYENPSLSLSGHSRKRWANFLALCCVFLMRFTRILRFSGCDALLLLLLFLVCCLWLVSVAYCCLCFSAGL